MGSNIRRQHSPDFKSQVVMELLKEEETISQICSKFSIHPTQAKQWKTKAAEILKSGFSGQTVSEQLKQKDKLIEDLYGEIGKLKYQLDWLKKKMGYTDS
ncbi:MAG: transposase [Chitinophagaceae bacterium]